jgi:hypothetical protein
MHFIYIVVNMKRFKDLEGVIHAANIILSEFNAMS